MKETIEFYEESIEKIKESLSFEYSVMDELFTFIKRKKDKYYVWTAIAYTKSGKPYYFYRLCKQRNAQELFEFQLTLSKTKRVYSDEAFSYESIYGKKSIRGKGAMTNKIENLHSQLRDKISYLVRKTKAHSKSEKWLNYRLAIFFNAKNLRLYGY